MKTPTRTATALLLAALLSGCANQELRRTVHAISVDGQVGNKHRVIYSSPTTKGIATVGALTLGVGPILLAAGINAAISSNPKHLMEAAAGASSVPLEKMAADAFTAELQHSGAFTLAQPGSGDAAFKLEIKAYGLESHGAIMVVRARLMKDSRCLFDSTHIGAVAKSDRHQFDEYKANPELFRIGWRAAAADAARLTLADLVDEFGLKGQGAAPPVPASARPAHTR